MAKYNTVFYYSPEDESYVTVVPALPGCMSDGKTISEALQNTQTIIEEWLQDAAEDGEPIPNGDAEELLTTSPDIEDVAGYILGKTGPITAKALEKLSYYIYAWALAWYGTPICHAQFQAWRDGPVSPVLFRKHQGRLMVTQAVFPNTHAFSASEKDVMDAVIEAYSGFDAEQLGELTHLELPWKEARRGLRDGEGSNRIISDNTIKSYYGNIQ